MPASAGAGARRLIFKADDDNTKRKRFTIQGLSAMPAPGLLWREMINIFPYALSVIYGQEVRYAARGHAYRDVRLRRNDE